VPRIPGTAELRPLGHNGAVQAGGRWARIYAVVRRIPRGRVATYGQVAELAGLPGHARQVGYALHALPGDSTLPWHRVVNAGGGVSRRADPGWDDLQRQFLEREGVRFDAEGRLSLRCYRWQPRARRARG
jgi:methylated-DNA-protein-cysteine methyltransferase related protein